MANDNLKPVPTAMTDHAALTPITPNKPPPLDLKKAAIVQAHMNVRGPPQDGEKDVRLQITDLKRTIDKLITEKNDLGVKLEDQFLVNQKLTSEIKYLKDAQVELKRVNSLLVRSHLIHSKRWQRISNHFEYLQQFYSCFSEYLKQDSFDPKVVGFDMRVFKEGFKTERNYNPDAMLDVKPWGRELTDRATPQNRGPEPSMLYGGNLITEENEPLNSRLGKERGEVDRTAAIMKLARDVYANKHISGIVPDPRDVFKQESKTSDRLKIQQVYMNADR